MTTTSKDPSVLSAREVRGLGISTARLDVALETGHPILINRDVRLCVDQVGGERIHQLIGLDQHIKAVRDRLPSGRGVVAEPERCRQNLETETALPPSPDQDLLEVDGAEEEKPDDHPRREERMLLVEASGALST